MNLNEIAKLVEAKSSKDMLSLIFTLSHLNSLEAITKILISLVKKYFVLGRNA